MNVTDYWPLASEYSIWNAAVVALQFWTANRKALVLSSTIEQVYNAFFYTTSMHLLFQQSEEVLFGHFVTMPNATFESKLTLEDKEYESGSENFNIPTAHHVSNDDISFNPITPHCMGTSQPHHKPVQHWLSFSTPDDEDSATVNISPTCSTTGPLGLCTADTLQAPLYHV